MSTLTYVVTGASRGLGLEFVKQISAKGHKVFALARNPDGSEGLKSLVDNKNVFAVKIDTTSKDSIKGAANQVDKHAPEGVDVLINNAGISGEMKYSVEDSPGSEYIKVFETNVVGVSDVTQAFLPLLRKRGQDKIKKILNMSSILGSIAVINDINSAGRGPAYSVSKAALNMYTKMLANQVASDRITVYSSHPGWVRTSMGGEQAPLEPEESIAGMLKVIDNLTLEKSGCFIDYEGKELNW